LRAASTTGSGTRTATSRPRAAAAPGLDVPAIGLDAVACARGIFESAATERGRGYNVAVLHGGTVTFVFTDIEGSTKLLERLGDRYAEALAQHRRLIREAFAARGGQEIDTQGDAFFYCFERARDAVAAAVAAQRALAANDWPDRTELRVRMSLHTGEPIVGEEGYVGIDVHRAARICSAGHGGQVLLSATTAALVSGAMPEGVSKLDLGQVRLKDMDEPEHVTQLVIDGLPQSFPPLRVEEEEEPMDFGERLARRIQADVERQIEAGLTGGTSPVAAARKTGMAVTGVALMGLIVLVLLVAAIVAIVLLLMLVL
jgi:class 3 adenylate cyclase